MARAKVKLVDRQLACMPVGSQEGWDYLGAMQAAANFAFGNRWVWRDRGSLGYRFLPPAALSAHCFWWWWWWCCCCAAAAAAMPASAASAAAALLLL